MSWLTNRNWYQKNICKVEVYQRYIHWEIYFCPTPMIMLTVTVTMMMKCEARGMFSGDNKSPTLG